MASVGLVLIRPEAIYSVPIQLLVLCSYPVSFIWGKLCEGNAHAEVGRRWTRQFNLIVVVLLLLVVLLWRRVDFFLRMAYPNIFLKGSLDPLKRTRDTHLYSPGEKFLQHHCLGLRTQDTSNSNRRKRDKQDNLLFPADSTIVVRLVRRERVLDVDSQVVEHH
jgi:hypothetical protein